MYFLPVRQKYYLWWILLFIYNCTIIGNNNIKYDTLSDGSYSNCSIKVTDYASNASSILSVNSFVVDTTPPQIISVSSSNADGIYRDAYDNITIQITFSEKVVIHNINSDNISTYPAILMETGSKDRFCILFKWQQ